ncbi:MAG TPA: hypothetical protein VGG38_17175 [Acidimicrobiales bacterium]
MKTGGKLLKSRVSAVTLVAAAVLGSMGAFLALGGVPAGGATSHALATSGLGYTPLSAPVRIADTRTGATDPSTYAGKTLAAGGSLTIDVPSTEVPSGASAVVVDITAIAPTTAGYLSVYPGGSTNPGTANIDFTAGQDVSNLVTVGLGTDSATSSTQSFTVFNGPTGGGTADFVADLEGYYAPVTATSGGLYNALTPTRIYDSRTGSAETGAGTTLTNGGSDNVTVTGIAGVPASATAVVLNVAVTNTTAPSYITTYPTGSSPSSATASQVFVGGETLSSQVIAGVGTGGQVTIANFAGSADIVVDVDGYFSAPGGTGSLLTILSSPVRLIDTRPTGVPGSYAVEAAVQGSGATAGVLSLADIYPTNSGGNYLTAYAEGATAPLAANVNYSPGDTYNVVENSAYATTSTATASAGGIEILNGPATAATANIVADEFGYFTPAATPTVDTVVVQATPDSLLANGTTTSSVQAAVSSPNDQAVSGDTVTFTVSPASCGTFSPTTAVTTSNGATPAVTYTSSTTSEACTVIAKESATSASAATTIDQTAAGASTATVAVTASPSSFTLAGQTSTITVTTSSGAVAVANQAITLSDSGSGLLEACGSLSATTGTTNASGVLTVTYTVPNLAGVLGLGVAATCTITATDTTATPNSSGSAAIKETLDLLP